MKNQPKGAQKVIYRKQAQTTNIVYASFPPKFRPFLQQKARWKSIRGGRGGGKLLDVETPIPTPSGWTTMGALQIGDEVFDEAGKPCRVIDKSEVQYEPTYKLVFSDGSEIVAGEHHLWVTWRHADRKSLLRSPYDDHTYFPPNWPCWSRKRRCNNADSYTSIGPQIRTTSELRDTLRFGKRGDLNHCIPQTAPLECSEKALPISPYVLGVWLGDGSASCGSITAHQEDMPHIRSEIETEGYRTTDHADPQSFGIIGLPLASLQVKRNKHVPQEYLRGSMSQRLSLLQGLMDTDGGPERGSDVSFCSTTKQLADAVYELVVSLGMKATRDDRIPLGRRVNGDPYARAYRVNFTATLPVFRLPRKLAMLDFTCTQQLRRHHRMIVAVEPVSPVPMQCISVDSPNAMYLCGRAMIPTHNTVSIAKALLLMGKDRPIRVLCCREIMQSIRESVHKTLEEEINNLGLQSYYTIERVSIYGPYVEVVNEDGTTGKKRTEFIFCGLKTNPAQIKSYANLDYAWVEEGQSVSEYSWTLLSPTVRNPGSEIWTSWNPENEFDATYKRFVVNAPDDCINIEINYWDNPWFAQPLVSEMEEMRTKDYEKYLHVWEGQCIRYYEGSVYLEELKRADEEGRICEVPYRSDAPCEVFIDIGYADFTALWVAQRVGDYTHLIEYYQNRQQSLDHFLQWVESKPYVINKYWLPHDARQRTAAQPMSYEQLVRAKGKRVQIVPSHLVADGINAVRTLFTTVRIDRNRCSVGLNALRNYRYEFTDDGSGDFKTAPVHDIYSHGADCLRYCAMALKAVNEIKTPPGKYWNASPFRGDNTGWMHL